MTAVVKGILADERITGVLLEAGCRRLADSRLSNLKELRRCYGSGVELTLLRQPMRGEYEEAARLADRVFISSIEAAEGLSRAAGKERSLPLMLMVEAGDGREGVPPKEAAGLIGRISELEGIIPEGLAINLFCLRKEADQREALALLCRLAGEVKNHTGVTLKTISGGSSGALPLLREGLIPGAVNELRIGEAILLGRETATGGRFQPLAADAFVLEAEVLEACKKRYNQIKQNRAVLAVGRHDLGSGSLSFQDENFLALMSGSDHLVIGTAGNELRPGDRVRAIPDYYGLLALMTSPYVNKEYK